MEYRSMADFDRLTRQWTQSLPRDLDLVVGISPGGMLAAGLLAWHFDVPSAELESLCRSRRRFSDDLERALAGKPRVLVVDDRAATGEALAQATARVVAAGLAHEVYSGAVIAAPEAAGDGSVEHFAELVPQPWVFEWEAMHDLRGASLCVDFDSVFAPSGAGAPLSPAEEIGWVMTSRPESRRYETELALRRQGIAYRELVMDCTDLSAAYAELPADMLVVCSAREAARIANAAGAPVFSIEAGSVLNAGDEPGLQYLCVSALERGARDHRELVRLPVRLVNKLSMTLVGRALVPVASEHHGSDLGATR